MNNLIRLHEMCLQKTALLPEAIVLGSLLEVYARHIWTVEERQALYDSYQEWVTSQGAIAKRGDIKAFLLSIKTKFPFVEDTHYYDTMRRQLYRVLIEHDVSWPGRGKRTLKETVTDTELVGCLRSLETLGYFIYEDGDIWYTDPPVTYPLYNLEAAIAHERKVSVNGPTTERQRKAQQALLLLEQFRNKWIKIKSKLYTPKSFLGPGYKVLPKANDEFEITSPEGKVYTINKKLKTCTCPAGAQGRECKHVREVMYHY